MNLFRLGDFTLAGGARSPWKIDCDSLTLDDWAALARMASEIVPPFEEAVGVPFGGTTFARAMRPYATPGCGTLLVCEDVVTTGGSIERVAQANRPVWRDVAGVCVFARRPTWAWVVPLFQMRDR